MMKHRKLVWLVVLIILLAGMFIWLKPAKKGPNSAISRSTSQPDSVKNTTKITESIDQASSLWVIVNKGRALPSDYVPAGLRAPNIPLRLSAGSSEMMLRSDAADALEQMTAVAKTQGVNLMLASGYRSYSEQVSVHNSEVNTNGTAAADAVSARPGHSEHQTGLAADLEPASRQCEVEVCFADTAEGQWLAANAYKYGFVIRYRKDTTTQTGYSYEPWHVRYLGKPLAADVYRQNVSLEKYFKLPFYQDYPAQSFQLTR